LLIGHASASARVLLQEAALERLHLHHEQIGLNRMLVVLRDGVVGDQIARCEKRGAARLLVLLAEFLELEQRLLASLLDAAIERERAPFAAIDRVAQLHSLQAKIVL